MSAVTLDYIVTKPAKFHLTADEAESIGLVVEDLEWGDDDDGNPVLEGEVLVEHGTRFPGVVAENWGGGRTVNHLVNNRILAAVPAGGSLADAEAAALPPDLSSRLEELFEAATQNKVDLDELEALRAKVAELEAANEVLSAAAEAAGEDTAAAVEGEPESAQPETETPVLAWGSEEWLARFDALEAAEAVTEVEAWGTGDGTAESPVVFMPERDSIESLLRHELERGQREDVVKAIEAHLLAGIEKPAVTDDRPFPRHKAGGVFILSDGSEVKGKQPAIDAQAELDSKNGA